jgi:serine/threonine protein kinase
MPLLLQMRKQWLNISNYAKDLISRMLEVDPEKRISVEEAIQHPWIKVLYHTNRPLSSMLLIFKWKCIPMKKTEILAIRPDGKYFDKSSISCTFKIARTILCQHSV